jgi:N-acetylmuramoyl-L-alanine amidase/putative methionine-R-sulfoxide reductase with GAF domain
MATNPSNTNPGLTIKAMAAQDTPAQGAGSGVVSADGREALQALLAFSTLHDQIRRKRAEEARRYAAGAGAIEDAWEFEQFVLDEVLQLVAERAQAITGADGIAIALAEGDEIICRASTGAMAPDRGVRLDAKAGFSGACFRTGRIVRCDDSEKDPRVNVAACRRLGTRSMVAVPLQGQQSVVGLLEAFSTEPYGFNDGDVRSLNLLAELILAALKPEDEDRIVRAAKIAAAELRSAELESLRQIPMSPPPARASVAESEHESVPLELSRESIAPALHLGENEGTRRGVWATVLLIVLGVMVGGAIWWRVRSASHARVAAAARNRAASAAPVAEPPAMAATNEANPPAALPAPSATSNAPVPGKPAGPTLVSGIRHWSTDGASTVVVDLQDPIQYEAHRLPDPERIYFDLLDTTLAPGLNGRIIDVNDGLIGRVRMAQLSENVTRVVLDTKLGSRFAVSLEQNPYRLEIEVRGAEAVLQPKARIESLPPVAPEQKAPATMASPSREDLQTRAHAPKLRIVLDPGHGGWDLGTIGREGLMEKNLVLDVAQRLGSLLENRLGSEVIFTRKDDNYVPLEQRAELANREQADLFVSVHANYSSLISARGVETYYSSFFSPPEAREIEYRENENALAATHAKLTGSQLKDKVDESRKLATSVQQALHGTLAAQSSGVRDRGVREASFVVLTGTEMPSILAEISFVSSPTDEERLRNAEYRQQIAEALYKGIERFATASHRVKMASTSGHTPGQ